MWMSTLSAWVMSVPTLILILFCIQDFEGIINGTYANNWAEYLVQIVGPKGAVAILSLLWVDSTCATASCFMSAQRVTYAISRDGILPGSKYFCRLSKRSHMPIHAAFLVVSKPIVDSFRGAGSCSRSLGGYMPAPEAAPRVLGSLQTIYFYCADSLNRRPCR